MTMTKLYLHLSVAVTAILISACAKQERNYDDNSGGDPGTVRSSIGGKSSGGGANSQPQSTGGNKNTISGTPNTGGVDSTNSTTGGTHIGNNGGSTAIGGSSTQTTSGGSANGGSSILATIGGTKSTGGTSSTATGGNKATGGTTVAGGTTAATTTTAPTTCTINSIIYATGAPNPNNACSTCQPSLSTSTWVALAEGAKCDNGKLCHQGSCQSGCLISSTFYAADAVKSGGGCWACKPGVSTTSWTTDGASCGCTGALQAVSESTRLCVAKPVTIPGPTASTGYSIDATEVTRDQYAAWLATKPALPPSSDANCGWKSTHNPDTFCMNGTNVCQGTSCGNHPQPCVDWCDAYAYCTGVGKRLCGKIGGGANAFADDVNASASQWYNACASGSAGYTFPYGNTYSVTTCNGGRWGNMTTVVGSLTSCQAPSGNVYSGVYDMSGNLDEWENSCDSSGQDGNCRLRGEDFMSDPDYSDEGRLVCGRRGSMFGPGSAVRSTTIFNVGFRCCAP
jgi:formylglycine-generating enzyme